MRKANQIRRAIIVVCVGLVFGFGSASFSAGSSTQHPRRIVNNLKSVPVSEVETETCREAVHDSGLIVQRPESPPRKIEGDWEGILDAGAVKLRLILHVVKKDGVLSATLDTPDQGAHRSTT